MLRWSVRELFAVVTDLRNPRCMVAHRIQSARVHQAEQRYYAERGRQDRVLGGIEFRRERSEEEIRNLRSFIEQNGRKVPWINID